MSGHDPSQHAPRFVPDEPLPPYSYVSGHFPHPTRDPGGHSFGLPMHAAPAVDTNTWRQSHGYLLGCDLFNHGYYWEAHETWEALWKACGQRGPAADLLKGLIKLAAAGVKAREGRPAGVARHAARAAELFTAVQSAVGNQPYFGMSLSDLRNTARRLADHPTVCEPTNEAVRVVFGFRLLPSP